MVTSPELQDKEGGVRRSGELRGGDGAFAGEPPGTAQHDAMCLQVQLARLGTTCESWSNRPRQAGAQKRQRRRRCRVITTLRGRPHKGIAAICRLVSTLQKPVTVQAVPQRSLQRAPGGNGDLRLTACGSEHCLHPWFLKVQAHRPA